MVFLLPHRGHRHEVPPFADENSNLVISGELLTVKGSLDQLPNPRTLCRLPATLSTCQHATQRKQAIKRYTNGIKLRTQQQPRALGEAVNNLQYQTLWAKQTLEGILAQSSC
jgi:hypothetical protein